MAPLPESSLLPFLVLASWAGSMAALASVTSSSPGASTGSSSVPDHLSLMSFKSLVRSDPSQALASWGNQSVPLCRWHGVTCGLTGDRRGRVVALDLAGLNLLGTVAPALGNITYLRRLNLARNRFHGVLPVELGNLHDLETLLLYYNSIQGQIPPSLSNCTRLVEISMKANRLRGGIPSELGSLHNLKFLNLGSNTLTGGIPSSFASLVNLKQLVLQFNNMTGEIPAEIGSLVNLDVISLSSNQFTGAIPSSLGNLSALTFLSIASNSLQGTIPPLQNLSFLSVLELGTNRLQGTIPPWLGNLSSLTFFDIQHNHIAGPIPESLGNLEQLQTLSLSENNLSGPIPQAIGNLQALTGLYLLINQLEGSLPPSMFNLSSVEIIEIQYNNLSGVFPPHMGSNLPKMNELYTSFNQFQGVLPASLCNASMLQVIETIDNFLSGTIPRCLGAQQKDLTMVDFAVNQFEAKNDADWGFMTSLTNCSNLTVLDIDSNEFQGVLPNSIGNLSIGLQNLNIAGNNISGTITEGIGNLINLDGLYMDGNYLVGTVPASLSKLRVLTELYLSDNELSGPITATLGNLTKLTRLDLSNNAISGDIPAALNNCPLQILDLSNNNFSGPIPKEIFLTTTLSVVMNLAHNSLSGTLPSEVQNLKNLGRLDLSNNLISGDIPTSIGECQSLEYLNMSGNLLQGTIPPSLGNLRGLSVLDLSYNNLSGIIPAILGNLGGLSSLNISFNKLQGGVPTDGVFLNATAIVVSGNGGLCGGIPQMKLQPCSNQTTKKPSWKLATIVSICSAFLFVTIILALCRFYRKSQKIRENPELSVMAEQCMRISYSELANATNGFASENLIGAGSFGTVYKGSMIHNGQRVAVAVKVLNLMQTGASHSFVAECETLRFARHRNLVKILTACSSIDFLGCDFKAIVYQFLPNGNLDQRLHQHIMGDGEYEAFDLVARLRIAIDVASSLDYLHQHKPVPIIHCDLKPSNVLLDSDMVAHVGDFGLARFLHQNSEKSSVWELMRGSIGYTAPEYGLGNEVSTHGDIYSFGILLLEMLTRRRPTDSAFGEASGLRDYVQMALPERVGTVVDQQLLTEAENDELATTSNSSSIRDVRIACIVSALQVGIGCSEHLPADRLPIRDALKELQSVRDKLVSTLPVKENHQAAEGFHGVSGA